MLLGLMPFGTFIIYKGSGYKNNAKVFLAILLPANY